MKATATKACRACGQDKPVTAFHRQQRSPDGFRRVCKACRTAETAAYRDRHREEINRRQQAARASDPQRFRDYQAQWRKKNPEKRARWDRAWREANPERKRDQSAAHYRANASTYKARAASWLASHPESARAKGLRYRARKAAAAVGPIDLAALWTGRCGICGGGLDASLRWPHALSKSVDHILPLALGGTHSQDNLQWAHLRCNVKKGAKTSS